MERIPLRIVFHLQRYEESFLIRIIRQLAGIGLFGKDRASLSQQLNIRVLFCLIGRPLIGDDGNKGLHRRVVDIGPDCAGRFFKDDLHLTHAFLLLCHQNRRSTTHAICRHRLGDAESDDDEDILTDPIKVADVVTGRFSAICEIDICDVIEQDDRSLFAQLIQHIDDCIPLIVAQRITGRVMTRIVDDRNDLLLLLHDFLAYLTERSNIEMAALKQ